VSRESVFESRNSRVLAAVLKPVGTIGEVLMFVESLIAPILLALIVFVLGRRAAR
jgi:hypothetical protein